MRVASAKLSLAPDQATPTVFSAVRGNEYVLHCTKYFYSLGVFFFFFLIKNDLKKFQN